MRSGTKKIGIRPEAFVLPHYDEIALVLQGGGALGAYQAGVYDGLAQVDVHPDWIAGISIGALNTAIMAGNAPENRVKALRGFWNSICRPPDWFGRMGAWALPAFAAHELTRKWASSWAACRALAQGQPGFFEPRFPLPMAGLGKQNPNAVSYYDTAALKATLLEFADFDRINDGDIRVSVGAVNVRTGNLVYFDNTKMRLEPEHIMASGALPPGFPAVEIDGEFYWDGGLVSNTPLSEVLRDPEPKNTLIFQVDLWSASGNPPGDFLDVTERTKDIQYSSRTRAITSMIADRQRHARLIKELLAYVPPEVLDTDPLLHLAREAADGSAINVVHLIYRNKPYEGHYKDYEFSIDTMQEHWRSGLEDICDSFSHVDWFDVPSREQGFVAHDVHRQNGCAPQSDRGAREPSPEVERNSQSSSLKMDEAS